MTIARAGVSILLCGVSATHCVALAAAEWLVVPNARVAADYTDNPRLMPSGGVSDSGAVAELSAAIQRRTGRSELSMQPRWRSSRYEQEESLSSDDQYLTAAYRRMSERAQWDASLGLTRDSTLTSEIGSTGIVQANRRHEGLTLAGGPSLVLTERLSAGAQVSWMDNHYVDAAFTGLVDYDYGAASLFSTWQVSERSALTLTAQAGRLSAQGQPDETRDATLRAAWQYQLDSMWRLNLSAGPAFVETQSGNDNGEVFSVDIARQDELWSVTARASRDLAPTGRGVLTRRDQITLGFNRRMSDRITAGLSARWVENQDLLPQPGVVFQTVTYGRLDLRADWRFAEHWSLAVGLAAAVQEYSGSPERAENHRASLSVIWNGQAQSF